jgi:hypothetical protein
MEIDEPASSPQALIIATGAFRELQDLIGYGVS